jgi:hypothetical protein
MDGCLVSAALANMAWFCSCSTLSVSGDDVDFVVVIIIIIGVVVVVDFIIIIGVIVVIIIIIIPRNSPMVRSVQAPHTSEMPAVPPANHNAAQRARHWAQKPG